MKLRIRGDSLRLRLTQAEVTTLAEKGLVEESIAFGPTPTATLTYAVVTTKVASSTTTTSLEVRFSHEALSGARIEVNAGADAVRAWAKAEDVVGMEATQALSEGRTLRILVEKDFACLKERPLEDDSDAFPNPKSSC